MAGRTSHPDSVFINCPFDANYRPLFEVMVFTVFACGFVPRCSLEASDSAAVRIEKILRLIQECRYGIHDISCVELDPKMKLPRFNMPFELGLDIGCRNFGNADAARKRILVLDRLPYRYQVYLSDIAGQDIRAHKNNLNTMISVVRHWLRTESDRSSVPGDAFIRDEFKSFSRALPDMCNAGGLNRNALPYPDYAALIRTWLQQAVRSHH